MGKELGKEPKASIGEPAEVRAAPSGALAGSSGTANAPSPPSPVAAPVATPPHLQALRSAGQVRTAAKYLRRMTNRSIVVFHPSAEAATAAVKALRNATGARLASTADSASGAISAADIRDAGGVVLQRLNAAVITTPPDQLQAASAAAAAAGAVLAVIPVGPLFAIGGWYSQLTRDVAAAAQPPATGPSASPDYLRGFRDGVLSMSEPRTPTSASSIAASSEWDESQATWGIQSTRVAASAPSGNGVRVAILDTGLDLNHPDFLGRVPPAQQQSFVPSATTVQDGNGHGTHVAGTACGIRKPNSLPRYGIASNAQLFVGKILGDDGIGYDDWFIAALDWAMTNGCRVVNMSVARPAAGPFDAGFELIARRALDAGTLIVAAAGNDAHRDVGQTAPVSHPANCPSIMAVAALDPDLRVGWFSNSGTDADGGQIDLAGPGVNVRSSWPLPQQYWNDSGTSMAAPHVTGIAAQWAEAHNVSDARALWSLLVQQARRLDLPSTDVGAGLTQAPA